MSDDRAHWDEQAETVGARLAAWSEPEDRTTECLQNILTGVTMKDGRVYVDLGCGWGRLTIPLSQRFPGAVLVGFDVSPAMMEARYQMKENRMGPAYEAIPGDGSLPTKASFVSGVYSMLMFQHVTDEVMERYIYSVANALRSTGWFRFQFVEGSISADRDRRRSNDVVLRWLREAGFSLRAVQHHLMYPDWTWMTAVKP